MAIRQFQEKSFLSEFGTINPGDTVVFMTKSTGFSCLRRGIYKGVNVIGPWHGRYQYEYCVVEWNSKTITLKNNAIVPLRT